MISNGLRMVMTCRLIETGIQPSHSLQVAKVRMTFYKWLKDVQASQSPPAAAHPLCAAKYVFSLVGGRILQRSYLGVPTKVPPPPTKKKGGGQKNGKSNDVPSKPSMHGKFAHVYHSTCIQCTFVYDSLAILGPIHMFESRCFSFNETWANLPAMDDLHRVTNLPPSLPALPRCWRNKNDYN